MTNLLTETPTYGSVPEFCNIQLSNASIQWLRFTEGQMVSQTIKHYICEIQLLDYSLEKNLKIEFPTPENSYFMSIELNTNSCFISYRPVGTYTKIFTPGHHKLLLVSFKRDWFLQKCSKLPCLKPFIDKTILFPKSPITLHSYKLAPRYFELLIKTDKKTSAIDIDKDIYLLINNYVNKYHNKLSGGTVNHLHHQQKALEIAQFIQENYASTLVEYLPDLANRFMVSERHLARLAKMTFGIPLHAQVIKIRMHEGLHQLMTTQKAIREISLTIGYKEPYYFSKAFKKHFGIPPYDWKSGKILPSN